MDDAELVKAARRRLRRLIDEAGGGGAVSNAVNHQAGYASASDAPPARTLRERMIGDEGFDDKDYKVSIKRRNVLDNEGRIVGWDKDVHRYVEERAAAKKRKTKG